jgi:hypothetical protein
MPILDFFLFSFINKKHEILLRRYKNRVFSLISVGESKCCPMRGECSVVSSAAWHGTDKTLPSMFPFPISSAIGQARDQGLLAVLGQGGGS